MREIKPWIAITSKIPKHEGVTFYKRKGTINHFIFKVYKGNHQREKRLLEKSIDLLEEAYHLAALGLQSKRYTEDPEFAERVDNILFLYNYIHNTKGDEDGDCIDHQSNSKATSTRIPS